MTERLDELAKDYARATLEGIRVHAGGNALHSGDAGGRNYNFERAVEILAGALIVFRQVPELPFESERGRPKLKSCRNCSRLVVAHNPSCAGRVGHDYYCASVDGCDCGSV